jgi:hypothetical protein
MVCGGPEKKWIPEANGSGCAAFDYNDDGWLDLLIVNGSAMPRLMDIVAGRSLAPLKSSIYLYRNLGDGRFEDVTEAAGLVNPYWGTGANAADFNNDRRTDILVTNIGRDLLFQNNGDGTFKEIGKEAGLTQDLHWHTGSAFGDYDSDGHLDLYVAGYVDIRALDWSKEAPVCTYKNLSVFCGPLGLKGERDILYHNNRNGTFTEVTRQAGVVDVEARYGFTVVFDDFNQDGKPDIFVANDSVANYLYINQGNGKFVESALISGVAYNSDGKSQANMGVAVGDYDIDQKLDLFVTTFSQDYFPLFAQRERGLYEEISNQTGLALSTASYLGWACGFGDVGNRGAADLWIANGHVYPDADKLGSTSYYQPFVIYQYRASRFSVLREAIPDVPANSYRGACMGDFNNDGRLDFVVLPISGAPLLLMNTTQSDYSWIGFVLQGSRSNRDAIGTKLSVEHCGQIQFNTLRNGGSYISRNDSRVHFGLGRCSKVDQATITWPNGKRQILRDIAANQYLSVRQP